MADSSKFRFVSPGIFLNEIDQSQIARTPSPVGPVLIGRFERGPAMVPVKVDSFSDLVQVFGNPIPGGDNKDVWRDGNYTAPTYAAFAAQAWLKNNAPVTIVRLAGFSDAGVDSTSSTEADAARAGWGTSLSSVAAGNTEGAIGLFVFNSSSVSSDTAGNPRTASLAAVWYCKEAATTTIAISGSIMRKGSDADGPNAHATASHNVAIGTSSANASGQFTAMVGTRAALAAGTADRIVFNFDPASENYIRNVFNTNPQLTNTSITPTAAQKDYWLGETFERQILNADHTALNSLNDITHGFMVHLQGDNMNWADHGRDAEPARTNWFISQDTGEAANCNYHRLTKLFRLVGLDASGGWLQRNLKVSIQDIKPPTSNAPGVSQYGTFTVAIRKIEDQDTQPEFVELFTNCTLDPNSNNYLPRKIGDKYMVWDADGKKFRHYGTYTNNSKFIRVELHPDIENGGAEGLLPFGFFGPPKIVNSPTIGQGTVVDAYQPVKENGEGHLVMADPDGIKHPGFVLGYRSNTSDIHVQLRWPTLPLVYGTAQAGRTYAKPNQIYFGIDTTISGSSKYDVSVPESLRAIPSAGTAVNTYTVGSNDEVASYTVASDIFTLDNVVVPGSSSLDFTKATYVSGSRTHATFGDGTTSANARPSVTAMSGANFLLTSSNYGYNRFTTVFHGGFDGLDVTEADPFRNSLLSGKTTANSYAFNSVKRAMNLLRDPESVEMNLASMPGLTNTVLTEHLINICEERADALAVIDLENDYIPAEDSNAAENAVGRRPNADSAAYSLKNRRLNSSYGAAYFPWVTIRDTLSDKIVHMPPSVVALGAMSHSERARDLWFAPAGFTRGGLSDGKAGLTVLGTKLHLTSDDRDTLYAANINPIATFPAEGVVVFGQKTLQATPSALDRINVRRLMIHVKREVSRIAATTLFEQNVQETWNNFKGEAETFLGNVKSGLGLTDFKVVLDETTTTPDLVDRNIMYAKIFLKPAQAIEFIALDFIITDSGASFDD